MSSPRIQSVATAEPDHAFDQAEALETAHRWLERHEPSERPFTPEKTATIFENAGVSRRHSILPPADLLEPRDFGDKSSHYEQAGLQLASRSLIRVLDEADLSPRDVDLLITVSCTGFTIPALDAHLLNEHDFPPSVRRLPIAELGCGAGASGIGRAFEYLQGHPNKTALVLSVELCTLNIHPSDPSRVQIVAGAMFGDGSAGLVLSGSETDVPGSAGFEVLDYETHFFQNTLNYMGYDNNDRGMKIKLSPKIPAHVKRYAPEVIENFLDGRNLGPDDINHWIVHPGGRAILDVLDDAYPSSDLRHSRRVLDQFGNLSSATVLYVLRSVMKANPTPGDRALLMAFGPGFYADMVLLRWARRPSTPNA